jgi:hypothetical protein
LDLLLSGSDLEKETVSNKETKKKKASVHWSWALPT